MPLIILPSPSLQVPHLPSMQPEDIRHQYHTRHRGASACVFKILRCTLSTSASGGMARVIGGFGSLGSPGEFKKPVPSTLIRVIPFFARIMPYAGMVSVKERNESSSIFPVIKPGGLSLEASGGQRSKHKAANKNSVVLCANKGYLPWPGILTNTIVS